MRKILFLYLVTSFALLGCSTAPKGKTEDDSKNVCGSECTQSNMDEYKALEGVEHVFLDTTYAQAIEKLNDATFSGIVYYGYPACPWCEEVVILINEAAKDVGLEIYYVNKKSEDSINNPDLEKETTKILDKAYGLDKNKEGEPHLYVPEVVAISKGEIVGHHMGTLQGHDANEREMTKDENDLLKTVYVKMFAKIKK